MSAVCQVTGRKPGYGKQVSHAKGTKTVDKRGIEAVVAELKAKEVKL
ncbi:large ribosomal subunit protein bL28 [Amycolatopsis sp. cmx-4-61]